MIDSSGLAFDTRREFAEGMTEYQLIDYIQKEANRYYQERLTDVSTSNVPEEVQVAACLYKRATTTTSLTQYLSPFLKNANATANAH